MSQSSKKTTKNPDKNNKNRYTIKSHDEDVVLHMDSSHSQEKKVKLYFIKLHPKTQEMSLTSVPRKVQSQSRLKSTLEKLIQGPSNYEDRKGLHTAIPKSTRIRSIRIRNNIATIDFNRTIELGANGAILIKRLDQIIYTATQFDNVNAVIIKINGRHKRSFGSDGISISGPLKRK